MIQKMGITRWTTKDEILFLKGLGTGAYDERLRDREKLLKTYLQFMNNRRYDSNIQTKKVRQYVVDELNALAAKSKHGGNISLQPAP